MCERRQIVVVGAGVTGASTALALARSLPAERFRVVVVPAQRQTNDLCGGPVIASQPGIRQFHADLGIDEGDLVRQRIASFSLGSAYAGWTGDGERASFSPFGDIGVPIGGAAFHQVAIRLARAGRGIRSSDYSIAALMAQAGRFAHPSNDPRSPLSAFTYGLHMHRDAYAATLLRLATEYGAEVRDGVAVELIGAGSTTRSLRLADGSAVAGDLFIDTVGLPGDEHASTWIDVAGPDRALSWEWADPAPPAPYHLIAATSHGWRVTTPGPGSVGEQFLYSSASLSEDDAIGAVSAPHQSNVTTLRCGWTSQPWRGNLVAVGRAASVLPPTAPVALQLAQSQIMRLLRLFPASSEGKLEAAEFNRETADELARTYDYLQVRTLLQNRAGDRFWDERREDPVSTELGNKVLLYRSRGRIPLLDGDPLGEAEWAVAFEVLGIVPQRYDALADALPLEALKQRLRQVREIMLRAIAPLPNHGDYLAGFRGRAAA